MVKWRWDGKGGCVEWLFAEDAEDAEGDVVVVIAIYPRVVSDDAEHYLQVITTASTEEWVRLMALISVT